MSDTGSVVDADQSVSHEDIDFLFELVGREIGVQLTGREHLVETRLRPLLGKCECETIPELLAKIRRGDPIAQRLAIDAMTTNETSFFRDQHPFETLTDSIIPQLLDHTGGGLTIWNGACSSGQESYSLAITLLEHFPHLAPRTRIVSTDVSPAMVERCRSGYYSRFEISRGVSDRIANKYFDHEGDGWRAKRVLRSMIKVREMNLLGSWEDIPRCDLVVLRNVLIYFTVDVKQQILRRIASEVLAPHGCLLLGASESTAGLDTGLQPRVFGETPFYFRAQPVT